jgi:drug/metabolite transporter (DMT)-like permease
MINIILKLISESLLSLYPIFVKKINISLDYQLWTCMISYTIIAFIFSNKSFIYKNLKYLKCWLFSFVTLIHIYVSYNGFLLLDSGGVALSIFYIYPIFILLLSGAKFNFLLILLTLFGVILLANDNLLNNDKLNNDKLNNDKSVKYKGILYILISVFTEVILYFYIKSISTTNHWNHLFLSYFFGAIIMTIYIINKYNLNEIKDTFNLKTLKYNNIIKALFINGLLGGIGYYLQFHSIIFLSPLLYGMLSYIGIITGYIYDILLNNKQLTLQKIIGSLLIIISNIISLL